MKLKEFIKKLDKINRKYSINITKEDILNGLKSRYSTKFALWSIYTILFLASSRLILQVLNISFIDIFAYSIMVFLPISAIFYIIIFIIECIFKKFRIKKYAQHAKQGLYSKLISRYSVNIALWAMFLFWQFLFQLCLIRERVD